MYDVYIETLGNESMWSARAHPHTHTHTLTLTAHAIESGPPEIGVEDFLHRWIVVDPLGGVCAPLAC